MTCAGEAHILSFAAVATFRFGWLGIYSAYTPMPLAPKKVMEIRARSAMIC